MIDKRRNRNRVIIAFIILLLIGGILYQILPSNKKITVINEDLKTVAFKHDSTWKLKQKDDDLIVLSNSGSELKIQITQINNEFKYSPIDDIIDELIYNIESQNKDYKLISKKNETITANRYNSYKYLFENDNEQVMVVVYKLGDKLITYIYQASNDYFDILLDSVHSIINSLMIKDESYELKDNIKMNLGDINYSTNVELDKLLNDTKTYRIAKNHYLVAYELPSIFNETGFDSTSGHYTYSIDGKSYSDNITISTLIYEGNIYSNFDENEYNVYSRYNAQRENKEDSFGKYTNFKETLSKFDSKFDSYIYKCSYDYNTTKYDYEKNEDINVTNNNENVRLFYALDNNHYLEIVIEADNLPITEKLISMIKVKESTNYSSYILNNKDGDDLVGELKTFKDYTYDTIIKIKILLPDKYKEVDSSTVQGNKYEYRHYRLNYDEVYDLYDYEIEYELSNSLSTFDETMKSAIDIINITYIKTSEPYGKYQLLTFTKKMTINGKEFYIYDGGHTKKSGIMLQSDPRKYYYVNKKVLFYKIDDKHYIEITINGNDKKIPDSLLKEVTNFAINEEKY